MTIKRQVVDGGASMAPRRILLCQRQNILNMYSLGSTIQDIARHYQVCGDTISKLLKECGVVVRHGAHYRKVEEKVARLIVDGYKEGYSTRQLECMYKISVCGIVSVLKRAGVKTRDRKAFSPDEEGLVIADYSNGLSIPALARRYNVSGTAIDNCLKRNAVTKRRVGQPRLHQIDEKAFHRYSETRNYLLGFLLADGYIGGSQNGEPYLRLTVVERDLQVIKTLQAFLISSHPYTTFVRNSGYKPGETMVSWSARSATLCQQLKILGMTSDRFVPEELVTNRDVFRGLVDGDGWVVCAKQRCLGLCGNRHIVQQFLDYMKPLCGTTASVRVDKTIFRTSVSAQKAVTVARHLYKNATDFLPRKMAKAIAICGNNW